MNNQNNCLTASNFLSTTGGNPNITSGPHFGTVTDLWPQWFGDRFYEPVVYDHVFRGIKREPDTTHYWITQNFPAIIQEFRDVFSTGSNFPRIDVSYDSEAQQYIVEAALAGIPKADIKITAEQGKLTFAYKPAPREQHDVKFLMHEIKRSGFERTIKLPETVDLDSVQTSYEDGMLRMVFAVRASARSREIQI